MIRQGEVYWVSLGAPSGSGLLEEGEAGLPKRSVVNVSQLYTVDKNDLIEKIGSLSPDRLQEVVHGIQLLVEPMEDPDL